MEPTRYIRAEVRGIPADVDETRTIPFTISTETRDRHKTVLKSDKWILDNYKRNPIVGYAHAIHGGMFVDPNPDMVIGKSTNIRVEGKELIADVTFEPAEINPLAEKIFQKVKFGSLRCASVGFVPTGDPEYGKGKQAKGQPEETAYYPGQELLEWSIVNIPSNPKAVKREMADDTEEWLSKVSEALDGKHTVEELRKMTIKGIVSLMTGEGVEKDEAEAEASQAVDNEMETKRLRQLGIYQVDEAFHNNFKELELHEERKRQEFERCKRDFSRRQLKHIINSQKEDAK